MSFIGLLRTLEQITRSPRLGHDLDLVEDGADQLAEREAETECLVPEDFNAVCRCVACVAEERAAEDELAADDEVSEPWEPELNSSERVALRQLIEDRFGDQTAKPSVPLHERGDALGCFCKICTPHLHETGSDTFKSPIEILLAAAELFPQHTNTSASTRTGAEPTAPADLLTAGSGPSEVSGHSPVPPSEGTPTSPSPQDAGTLAGDRPGSERVPGPGHPDASVAEWIGEAVPVINEVLTEHTRILVNGGDGPYLACSCDRAKCCVFYSQHVAPFIANALAPQPK